MARPVSTLPSPTPEAICWEVSQRYKSSPSASADLIHEIDVWRDLLERDPENTAALRSLEELYERTGQAEDYLDLLERRVDRSGSDEERDVLYQRMAAAWEDTFHRPDRARACLEKRPALEAQYRRMITRLERAGSGWPERRAAVIALWDNLGEIYRSRFQDFGRAAAAYERALAWQPDDARRLTILGELYQSLGPSQTPGAVEAQHTLRRQAPGTPEPYHALRHLYLEAGAYDRAYCACAALAILRAADASERVVVERFRPAALVRTAHRLTEELWTRHVRHPTEDPRIGAVFASLCDAVALRQAQPLAGFGARRRRRRRGSQQERVAAIIGYVSQLLGGSAPETFENPDLPTSVAVANCREESVLVPTLLTRSDRLGELTDAQLAFVAARQLTVLRPDHFLMIVVPTLAELRTLYLAGLEVAGLPLGAARTMAVASYADGLRTTLAPYQLERLQRAAQDASANLAAADLERWMRAIELTSHRAGLVACGDPEVAAEMLMQSSAATTEMRDELCGFVASEEYFDLREYLEVTVSPDAA